MGVLDGRHAASGFSGFSGSSGFSGFSGFSPHADTFLPLLHFHFWCFFEVFFQSTTQRLEKSPYADTPTRRPADPFPQDADTFPPLPQPQATSH
jgi:hypothetical protein